MATTAAKTAGGSSVNNGATVAYAGNIDTTNRVTQALGFASLNTDSQGPPTVKGPETNATIAAGTDTHGTFKPYAAGTFVYRVGGLVRGVTASISGVASTLMTILAGYSGRQSIHKVETMRGVNITSWDYVTGAATIANVSVDAFGNDHAARPTRAVPGEYVFMETGKTPAQNDYPVKTGG